MLSPGGVDPPGDCHSNVLFYCINKQFIAWFHADENNKFCELIDLESGSQIPGKSLAGALIRITESVCCLKNGQ
jgi:hypothetical protein